MHSVPSLNDILGELESGLIDDVRSAADAILDDPREIVLDAATGRPRQAGADSAEGAAILEFRREAEASLYVFTKGILGRDYLTPDLHRPVCDWLQTCPMGHRRKGLLLPREHAKTTIVSHGLPIHILIQPEESNLYFPGQSGADQRVLLACETEGRGKDHLRVVESAFETNDLIRAFWPHRCWENPRRESKKWNDVECIIPRKSEFPDPSIRVIGVGGAITGVHPTVTLKDDLVTLEAANSPTVMQTAIEWHIASRALMNSPDALEFILGTRWHAADLYAYAMENDPSVEWIVRAIVENGKPIYPEFAFGEGDARRFFGFSTSKIAQLQREFGVLFPLIYMNSAADPSLVDFSSSDLREYEIIGGEIVFREDEADLRLVERLQRRPDTPSDVLRGAPLNADTFAALRLQSRLGGVRMRVR